MGWKSEQEFLDVVYELWTLLEYYIIISLEVHWKFLEQNTKFSKPCNTHCKFFYVCAQEKMESLLMSGNNNITSTRILRSYRITR